MRSRPKFVIEEFVRARNKFDDGNGPTEAWTRIHEISLWRIDELAEQAGSRSWALFIAPAEPERDHESAQQRLIHAVRSGGLGNLSLPTFWRAHTGRVSLSRMLVVYEIGAQRAVRLARRYAQVAIVHVQRVPYEDVVLLNVTNEQSVQLQRYKPGAIADALASILGAAAVAMTYRATSVGESQLMDHAERRLRSEEPR